ncbi:mannose-1-phosphate guanylyltransferase/mannose-6-phosphate isomerase [Microbulbifer sp. CAU 1566]|uniref:mannose-1-phosphate guanylyltransferase/mannose-6-phosphate isomerase n=1 Tax=Microbulbifer sp. CAU 1566 TaxID=2933269 RepID=UPI0020033E7C|nr:mannose-1-phosphate guanylyltransferase/mannose-6-phosphate isomerase [Microbulbifer sp. CAU 1566]MCK7597365.1 mannose-1-phosphate guanylyltransferase/mannose-6-phosphate isomerase [Microbulbifer sp. CAU 1566]
MTSITPVILCGGSGTRLWPKSRKMLPKQLLSLTGEQTMLQQTLERVRGFEKPVIVCNEDHRFMVAQQAQEIGIESFTMITEPTGRNTAPAITFAAVAATKECESTNLLVLPADHLLDDVEQFHRAVDIGLQASSKGGLVTFGIVPTAPETGYGYIQKATGDGTDIRPIAQFVEKPNKETATAYIESGEYYWNAGMFLFSARNLLDELAEHAPAIHRSSVKAMDNAKVESDFVKLNLDDVNAIPEDSIDYAVMEKTRRGFVVPLACGWSDVGSWSSLWEALDKDEQGNVALGDVIMEDCKNSLVFGEDHLVAAVGVEDLIIVDTKNATLVAPKGRAQEVKAIVSKIKTAGRDEHEIHREVARPWGKYDSIGNGERFQVKRITVNPGASLSLQMHHHRAEHWVVVSGTAIVQRDEEEIMLSENESVYIPIGVKHRLTNPGLLPLEIIEVQSGSYLGEDDIVRFDDIYGRKQ